MHFLQNTFSRNKPSWHSRENIRASLQTRAYDNRTIVHFHVPLGESINYRNSNSMPSVREVVFLLVALHISLSLSFFLVLRFTRLISRFSLFFPCTDRTIRGRPDTDVAWRRLRRATIGVGKVCPYNVCYHCSFK